MSSPVYVIDRRMALVDADFAAVCVLGLLLAMAERRRNGLPVPPEWRAGLEQLRTVAEHRPSSASGSVVVLGAEVGASSGPLGTAEAASRLGCSARWVRRLIRDGVLPARRNGREWLVDPEDVERLLEERSA